ncbi:MAG: phage integrase family protein [Rhodospirillaceae bacterium]|nr:MAG: phage integrase family protein [Rhodospirillaceae bacterium]
MKLTQRAIDALECPPGQRDRMVFDDTQKGLAVRVMAKGSKSYIAQYTIGGQKRRVPLGSCGALSLAAAREAARAVMGEVAKNVDVFAERKAAATARKLQEARDAMTLRVLIDDWHSLHLSGMRASYAHEAMRALRSGLAAYLDLPAAEITRPMAVKALDAMARERGAVMAARTVAYAKAAFSWAIKRGAVTVNPFSALPVPSTPSRDRVLTDDELAAVWKAADPATTYGALVRMLVVTGQRRDEVAGMIWDEVSPDCTMWTLPGDRTKNSLAHAVPLAPLAQALIAARPRRGEVIFAGRTDAPFNGWSASKSRLDAACGVTDWRLHDLRRPVATGLQRLGTPAWK